MSRLEALQRAIESEYMALARRDPGDPVLSQLIETAQEIFLSGEAKRIRAVIPVLVAEERGLDARTAIQCGVLVEVLHFASLMHDDVLDGDDERRGKPTVNALYHNAKAILIGDYFLCQAFDYALEQPDPRSIIASSVEAIRNLIVGGALEERMKSTKLGYEAYELMAIRKTGALFALAFGLPFAGLPEEEHASELGRRFGLLFQIYDDRIDREQDAGFNNLYHVVDDEVEIREICRRNLETVRKLAEILRIPDTVRTVFEALRSHGYFEDLVEPAAK